jgi:hypothetical protein
MRAVKLFGIKVAPVVAEVEQRDASAALAAAAAPAGPAST